MIHVLYASWHKNGSAEHTAAIDAASPPRDRAAFDGQYHTNVVPIYQCGATKRQSVGSHHHLSKTNVLSCGIDVTALQFA